MKNMTSNCYGQGREVPELPSLRHWPSSEASHTTVNDEALSDDSASISMRLFGRVLSIGTQVCKGPCVGNDKLAFAFASDKS